MERRPELFVFEVRVHSWKRTRHDFGPATALQSHHPIFGPWVPPAGVELLVLGRRRSVDGFRVEGGVDVPQQRNDDICTNEGTFQ